MRTSEQINELSAALAKAQGAIVGALKDSSNPFFKSKYADLASCWEACRSQLSSNGLAVIQCTEIAGESGLGVTTRLTHSSGQWVEGTLMVYPKDNSPQAAGSAITYARRYALASIVGIAQVDDDGEAAQGRDKNTNHPKGDLGKDIPQQQALITSANMRDILQSDVDEDVKALHVLDMHDLLRTQHDLYVRASDELSAGERSAWKKYIDAAKKRAAAEPIAANGRR